MEKQGDINKLLDKLPEWNFESARINDMAKEIQVLNDAIRGYKEHVKIKDDIINELKENIESQGIVIDKLNKIKQFEEELLMEVADDNNKLIDENNLLKQQIESMKMCYSCKFAYKSHEDISKCNNCEKYDKWELKED